LFKRAELRGGSSLLDALLDQEKRLHPWSWLLDTPVEPGAIGQPSSWTSETDDDEIDETGSALEAG
jgi:hypothetical protein